MTTKIDISSRTIIFLVLLLFAIWFVIQVRSILLLLFVSFILMSALRSLVERLEKWHLPRALAILFAYVISLSFLTLSLSAIVPPLINESSRLLRFLPQYSGEIFKIFNINVDFFTQQIGNLSGNIIKVTLGFFNNLITFFTLLFFTFYLLLEREHLEEYLDSFVGEVMAKKIAKVIYKVESRLGKWVRGQIILCFIIGLMSFIGLTILGINYALPLALIAGIFEIVPVVGPIVSAVPAVLIALLTSPILALVTAALYFLIQQVENNFIVPKVMQSAVGLKPIVTILALMIGAKLMGITGAVLAVPAVLILQTISREVIFGAKKS